MRCPAVRKDDLRSRRTGVADLGERAAQPPPAGVLRRRGRRRVAWITATALAVVLAIGLAGLAVRDRVGLDQAAVNLSAGSISLPVVSDLGPIVGIQLLDATSGWALTAGRLAWTDSGGANWRTITPTGADGLDLLTAFFLDPRTGWLVAADLPRDGRPTELTAFRTVDGGTTWQHSTMGSASVQQSEDGTGPMNLSFVDGRHGWLRVTSRLPGQRAEEETGTLLRTSNGGRTWERPPDAPTPGGIRFVTRQRGWQAWVDALWETRDGGRTWIAVPSLAAAPGQGGRLEFAGLPTILANGAGFVPVLRYRRDPGLVLEAGFAETRDSGTTWSAPRLAPIESGNLPTMAVTGSGTLLVLSGDQRTLASSDDHGNTWTTRRSDLAGRGFTATYGMTFPDATSGWLLSAFLDGCSPDCDSKGAVLSTRSAGRSWAVILAA
jgi:photosystem II stability/assembly factor-like uncharacterized protein